MRHGDYGGPGLVTSGSGFAGVPPVPFEQPKNLFRYGEQSLWSSQRFGTTVALANNQSRLFATPISQNGQGFSTALTIAETNLKEGGRIPAGIAFDAYGVSCGILLGVTTQTTLTIAQPASNAEAIADLVNVANNGVLSWDFTQTAVDIAPISLIGAGGGVFGSVAITATTQTNPGTAATASVGNMNNGAGTIWIYRKHPVALPGNSTFSILLRFGGNAAAVGATYDLIIKVALFGFYKNVIEIG